MENQRENDRPQSPLRGKKALQRKRSERGDGELDHDCVLSHSVLEREREREREKEKERKRK